MKIVHVTPTYLPATRYGGPIFAVHGLARALASRGHEVEVLTTNVDGSGVSDVPLDRPVELDGVRVRYFPSLYPRLYWSPQLGRAARDAAAGADILHAHAVFLWPTLATRHAALAASTPLVISPRGMLVPELISAKSPFVKRTWIRLFEERNLRSAAAVHFTSELEKNDALRAGLGFARALVIPNGVDAPPPLQVDRVPGRIIYLGRISWKKRIDRLIDVLALTPDTTLVIAGNDDEGLTPTLQQQARDAGVAARIEWKGPLYGAEKDALLASASVFALTSDSENFGNAVLEALAQETPAVLTPGVGLAEELGRAGAATVAGTVESLASAVSELLHDDAKRAKMGTTGRELVEQRFSWPTVAAAMEVAYTSVIKAP